MKSALDVAEAEAWLRSQVPLTQALELVQSEPWASVYRCRAGGRVLWFKACAETHAFEVPFTARLSARWEVVTEVLGHDVKRRWLLMDDAGEPLSSLGNPPARWLEILPRYAELQIGEAERVADHLKGGVPDLRPGRLPELYEQLSRTELPLTEAERSELEAFLPMFSSRCAELEGAGIAATVQHDDLHPYNAYLRGEESLRVLDWGDASIGHPFFSLFETFRFLSERNGLPPSDAWFARLRDAYLEPWGPGQQETFALALELAAAARSIAWLHQRDALPESDRRNFDAGFDHMLRLALRGLDGGPGWT